MLKKLCPRCQGDKVKKKGFYENGKQRWFCNSCKRSFSWKSPECKQAREQVWFKLWIVEGYSVRQLSLQIGHSRAKLNRIVNYWLNPPPEKPQSTLGKHKNLIFDGTFLHRPVSIFTLLDAETNSVISGK